MKKFLALFLVLSLTLVLAACGGGASSAPAAGGDSAAAGDDTPAATGGTVKVGLASSLTGEGAFIGAAAQRALEDYIEELNERGGLLGNTVELVAYDYAVDPGAESVNVINRLIDQDQVLAVLGPHSSMAGLPMGPIADAGKTPMITSASNAYVTVAESGDLHPYVFRVCYIDPYLGDVAASYAYNEMGLRDVAVLETVGDAYSEGLSNNFRDSFTALGGNIVTTLGHQSKDVEFRALITDAKDKEAEAIFCSQTTYLIPSLFANQAADMGVDFQYLLGDAVYAEELLEAAGPALEGAICAIGVYDNDPSYTEYKEQFAAAYPGYSANMYVMYSLDCMMLLEWAVNESQSLDREVIRDTLENAKNVELFTDKDFTMDPATHNPLNKTVNIMEITDSTYVMLDSFRPE